MPHKSKRVSNLTIIIGGAFAFLLIMSSFFLPQKKLSQMKQVSPSSSDTSISNNMVSAVSGQVNSAQDTNLNADNWKSYRDSNYNFVIKYPAEWANPIAEKINDPDFAYEYQVSFGTEETLQQNGIEGFSIFVYQTDKCVATDPNNQSSNISDSSSSSTSCATQKTVISNGAVVPGKIFEFASKVYTYTIVSIIPESGADSQLVQKASQEAQLASQTFTIDTSLKLPLPEKINPVPQIAPSAARPVVKGARTARITGGIPAGGGKFICPHPNQKPARSPNKGNHVDEDCCPDPDEWPNALCIYKPSDYKIMLKP